MSKIETSLRSLSGNARPSITARNSVTALRTPARLALGPLLAPIVGGADRIRTGDPLLAKQVLSQLSYSPIQIPGYPGI